MKLNANAFQNFIKNVSPSLRFFLFYGPEGGKIKNLSHKLIEHFLGSSNEQLNLIHFNYKQIKDDSKILLGEMLELSLLGGRKIIVIEDSAATINKDLQELIKSPPKGDALVIFLADELKPTSSLRKACEISNACMAIACYKDDPEQIKVFVRQYLTEKGFSFESSVPDLLARILPPNQILIVNELERLITYKLDDNQITEGNIASCFDDASELVFDDLCFAFALKDHNVIQKYIKKMQFEDTNFVMVIRILLKYFSKLMEVKTKTEENHTLSVEQAVSSLSPPVFFKQKENLIMAAKKLSLSQIKSRLNGLMLLELKCKKGILDPQILTFNYLTHSDMAVL